MMWLVLILGAKFHADQYPSGTTVNTDINGFIIAESAEVRQFIDPQHYLFPIPAREISLNPLLEQNPGWK